jgi:SAM-dependent methyltransferase
MKALLAGTITEDLARGYAETIKQALLVDSEAQWDGLFEACSAKVGKDLSRAERAALHISRASMTYGEVTWVGMANLLWSSQPHMHLPSGGVFYDLGSGTGRAVFAAALLHDWDKCVGVELLEGLHGASLEILNRFNSDCQPKLPEQLQNAEIRFERASFLDFDWSDGDVVFANSTCFDAQLMLDLANSAERLRPGAYIITLTKPLSAPYLKLIDSTAQVTSWGNATVHVHQRVDGAEEGGGNYLVLVESESVRDVDEGEGSGVAEELNSLSVGT